MITFAVDLGERSYPIHIGPGALAMLGSEAARLGATRVLVCTNETVGPLYAAAAEASLREALPGTPVTTFALPDGEGYKDLGHVESILDACAAAGLDRRSLVVALGGGVVGDMAGFAAGIWMRGIRFIQVPTTLLAQVDSSVGGKTGANLAAGKNLVGLFHQPRSVLIDPSVLKTLPARELRAGTAEIIKYGILGDAILAARLERDMEKLLSLDEGTVSSIVEACCRMKACIVRADEREGGVRARLNLGHTFGHAIEKLTGYGTWLHGEAVAAGTVMAARLSRRLGFIGEAEVERISRLFEAAGLPVSIPGLSAAEAWQAMKGDKKAVAGEVRFVVIRAVGHAGVMKVSEAAVMDTMRECGWA